MIWKAGFGVWEGFHGMRSKIWSQMDTTRAPDLDSEIKIYRKIFENDTCAGTPNQVFLVFWDRLRYLTRS